MRIIFLTLSVGVGQAETIESLKQSCHDVKVIAPSLTDENFDPIDMACREASSGAADILIINEQATLKSPYLAVTAFEAVIRAGFLGITFLATNYTTKSLEKILSSRSAVMPLAIKNDGAIEINELQDWLQLMSPGEGVRPEYFLGLSLAQDKRHVLYKNKPMKLTKRSKTLLKVFVSAAREGADVIVTRGQLQQSLSEKKNVNPVTASTYVGRLRYELKHKYPGCEAVIDTVGHTGWRLVHRDMLVRKKAGAVMYVGGNASLEKSFAGFQYSHADTDIFFDDRIVSLTLPQKKIMIALLEAQGEAVSIDELAKILYPSELKDKRYVIWKHLSNLRERLAQFSDQTVGLIQRRNDSYYLAAGMTYPSTPRARDIHASLLEMIGGK